MDAIAVRKGPTLTASEPLLLFRDFERMGDFWDAWDSAVCNSGSIPLDMYNTDEEVLITAQLVGVEESDIDVDVDGDCLSITAMKKLDEVKEGSRSFDARRAYGELTRKVTLPPGVDVNNVSASFADGTLEVEIPKVARPANRHVEVKPG